MSEIQQPGTLVNLRGRNWVVLPSSDPELLRIKPLGGSDEEETAIFLPLHHPADRTVKTTFPSPSVDDLDDFDSAKLLFHATRLSFRNASGPFRCMGKLSFRPRAYQIVPTVMALGQFPVRLLIADDVGVGKTVEALIILKELMERGEVTRFAVICLPHLCEQWQQELKDKLDIDAEIIRSGTIGRLERKLPDDRSVFQHFPYQVISVDYIKGDKKKALFLPFCPDFIIVDEVHTCARPAGTKSVSQQQRFHLLHDIANDPGKSLVFLTATPHSGKDEEFKSILELLKPEFKSFNLSNLDDKLRKQIAGHFIQRKREHIVKWLNEDTPFPKREVREIPYKLSDEYAEFYNAVIEFARGLSEASRAREGSKMRYWAALALLRGVMSSPASGFDMLNNRAIRKSEEIAAIQFNDDDNPVIEDLESASDQSQEDLLINSNLNAGEIAEVNRLKGIIEQLFGLEKDNKLRSAAAQVRDWVAQGYNPVIFCRYIATANYVAKELKAILPKDTDVQAITSEMTDDERKMRIEEMGSSAKRVLIATDCMSEGINLQNYFTAVMHYDLPWNPNRIEQREGRIDRFGQPKPLVKAYLLWGEDNPVDAIILKVLISKVRKIKDDTGESISIAEGNKSIADAVLNQVLIHGKIFRKEDQQLSLFKVEEISQNEEIVTRQIEEAREKARVIRSIFAHESIKLDEIKQGLDEVDDSIGNPDDVKDFVLQGVRHLDATITETKNGFQLQPMNLPEHLKMFLPNRNTINISFKSPTPEGHKYIGRNHRFTENLCHLLVSLAFEKRGMLRRIARTSVIQTGAVSIRTTLVQFRVRNIVRESGSKHQVIAEEMYLWGFEGSTDQPKFLEYKQALDLLLHAKSGAQLSPQRQQEEINHSLSQLETLNRELIRMAEKRAENLVEAHSRFRKLLGSRRYEAVYPVLPPDVLGVYVLIPQPKKLI